MRYAGALFDLFGTLVAPYRTREHQDMLRACAAYLGVAYEDAYRLSGETYPLRMRGEFPSIRYNLAFIARTLGGQPTPENLAKAEACYERFTLESLEPVSHALDLLELLSSRGVRLGLVTNCAPDIPSLWDQTAFARFFDHCAFSCQVRSVKPEPEIYRAALDALGLAPAETLYVGDGSDDELEGAARCGLTPVLVTVDLSNTYDSHRPRLADWQGARVANLAELRSLLE